MPNWCFNEMTIRHHNTSKIEALVEAFHEKGQDLELFAHFLPIPEDQKDNWYSWSIENWGSKWDASIIGYICEDNEVVVTFDSAWSPPIALYEYLLEEGWEVEAKYHEPGMGLLGTFSGSSPSIVVEAEYDYDYDSQDESNPFSDLPEDLVEFANLREDYNIWLEEKKEENQ